MSPICTVERSGRNPRLELRGATDELLEALAPLVFAGTSSSLVPAQKRANSLLAWRSLNGRSLCRICVVVEGLFAARPELRELVDIRVVVETSTEIRAERQALRDDGSPEWLRRWDLAERHYLSEVCRLERFDFRVSGR